MMKSRLTRARAWLRQKRAVRKLLIACIPIAIFLLVMPIVTYAHYAQDIEDVERLMNRNNTGIVLLDRHGKPFYSLGNTGYQNDAELTDVSDWVEDALVASEDKGFYEHAGFSIPGMLSAVYANVVSGDLQRYGGSTITQQLVKNTLLSDEKSFFRKYQEVSIAVAIEQRYSKEEILEMYLNSVYFGEGAFGIGPAAKTYFNKNPGELTLAESSMLIGLLPAPSAYSPVSGDPALAKQQQERVLTNMVEINVISEEEKQAALQEPLQYAQSDVSGDIAPHFALMVLEEVERRYGEEMATRSGFRVTTSLDLEWQKQAEQLVRERVQQLQGQGGTNASLVAIDPSNGEVRALVGSADWHNEEFGKVNMATSPRQPGSSFKPIFYGEAFEKRLITPATILKDEPKTYGTYRPLNYDRKFRGDISVRKALAQSLNIPAIEVMEKLGVNEASQAARRMGVSTVTEPEKYGLSLALGTAETKLLEMTNAYAALAHAGMQYNPTLITSIEDKYDKTIYTYSPQSKRVISSEAAYLVSSILSDNAAREPVFGSSLTLPGRTAAVKTGTTNDNKDAWTIGYTPSLTIGVWMGNNANMPMSGIAGSSGAAPIWKGAVQSFLAGAPDETFVAPEGIEKVRVCSANGLRANGNFAGTHEEYFIKGTVPSGSCEDPQRKILEELRRRMEEFRNTTPEAEPEEPSVPPRDEGGRSAGRPDTPPGRDRGDREEDSEEPPDKPPEEDEEDSDGEGGEEGPNLPNPRRGRR